MGLSFISELVRKLHSELLLLLILFLTFFGVLNIFFTNVYALNFAIMGIGPYVSLALFLLSPFVLMAFKGKAIITLYGTSGLLIITRILSFMFSDIIALSFIAGVGVAAFSIFFPIYLARRDGGYVVITQALTIAIGISIALKSIGSSVDFLTYGWGKIISWLLAAIGIFMIAGMRFQSQKESQNTERKNIGKIFLSSMGLYGILAMEWYVLAYPSVLSRWSDSSYVLVTAITIAAIASFAIVVSALPQALERLKASAIIVANLLLVTSVVIVAALPQQDLGAIQKIFTYLTAVLSPVALLDFMLLVRTINLSKPTTRQLGGCFGISSIFFLILSFAMTFSFNYEFIPGMSILRDRVYLVILAAILMAVVPTLVGLKKFKVPRAPHKIASILICLSVVGTGIGLGINSIKPDTPKSPQTITVMSFNVHQGEDMGGKINFDRVMETIERSGAEIICLQETETARISFGNVDLVRFLAEGLDMYSYYGPKTVTGTYGIALLSKFPIESAETTFMPSKDSQRAIIKSEIRVGTEIITVYNTHFGLALSDRALQAKLTADLAANSSRALLAGDFNTPDPAETPYVTISSKFRDGWLEINSSGTDILGATFDWKNPTERIDYIFFTPDLNIIDFRILDWAHESDHMPIVAVFEL